MALSDGSRGTGEREFDIILDRGIVSDAFPDQVPIVDTENIEANPIVGAGPRRGSVIYDVLRPEPPADGEGRMLLCNFKSVPNLTDGSSLSMIINHGNNYRVEAMCLAKSQSARNLESINATVLFERLDYTVEVGGTATVRVLRVGDLQRTVEVNYSTADGTAVAGTDYTTAAGKLTFGPGVTSKTFNVVTLSTSGSQSKFLTVALSNPVLCAIQEPDVTNIQIRASVVMGSFHMNTSDGLTRLYAYNKITGTVLGFILQRSGPAIQFALETMPSTRRVSYNTILSAWTSNGGSELDPATIIVNLHSLIAMLNLGPAFSNGASSSSGALKLDPYATLTIPAKTIDGQRLRIVPYSEDFCILIGIYYAWVVNLKAGRVENVWPIPTVRPAPQHGSGQLTFNNLFHSNRLLAGCTFRPVIDKDGNLRVYAQNMNGVEAGVGMTINPLTGELIDNSCYRMNDDNVSAHSIPAWIAPLAAGGIVMAGHMVTPWGGPGFKYMDEWPQTAGGATLLGADVALASELVFANGLNQVCARKGSTGEIVRYQFVISPASFSVLNTYSLANVPHTTNKNFGGFLADAEFIWRSVNAYSRINAGTGAVTSSTPESDTTWNPHTKTGEGTSTTFNSTGDWLTAGSNGQILGDWDVYELRSIAGTI